MVRMKKSLDGLRANPPKNRWWTDRTKIFRLQQSKDLRVNRETTS